MNTIIGKTSIRVLPVQLTAEERISRGETLAHICTRRMRLEERKKRISKEIGRRDDALVEQLLAAKVAIETGVESRDVVVRDELQYVNNKVVTVRLDTGEIVAERPAGPRDAQLPMFGEDGSPAVTWDQRAELQQRPESPPEGEAETDQDD